MNATHFDSMTRFFALPVSRRSLIGVAAAFISAAAMPAGGSRAAVQDDASALVSRFYQCIDAYQYEQAYALLGAKWQSEQSLATFTKGYGDTAFVQCKLTGTQAATGGTTVFVKLIAWRDDGKIFGYTGHYLVGSEQGQPRLLSGNNTREAAPKGTSPLCAPANVAFSFGRWNGATGSLAGFVIGKNSGTAACVLGGSPRLHLADAEHRPFDSTSIPGSPPEAVVVKPGETAQAPIHFSNYCVAPLSDPVTISIQLPGDIHEVGIHPSEFDISYPRCDDAAAPAHFDVLGWTASASN